MKYAYSAVEAAALWADREPAEILSRMEASDLARLEADHAEAVAHAAIQDAADREARLARWNFCDFQCQQESQCPDWLEVVTEDGDVRRRLRCPQGFRVKPRDETLEPRVVRKPPRCERLLPHIGEFSDVPGFEERLAWLMQAISSGDLAGSPATILARDLRRWVGENFPGDPPPFLYAEIPDQSPALAGDGKRGDLDETSLPGVENIQRGPKRVKQFAAILAVATELDFSPMRIPEAGKQAIRRRCVAEYPRLFTDNDHTFDGIWQDAVDDGLVRTAGHDNYARR